MTPNLMPLSLILFAYLTGIHCMLHGDIFLVLPLLSPPRVSAELHISCISDQEKSPLCGMTLLLVMSVLY